MTLICAWRIHGWRYAAQRDALIEGNIIIDLGRFADDDACAVVDHQASADAGSRISMPVASRPSCEMTRAARNSATPERAAGSEKQKSMETRIAKRNFQARPRRRVARQEGVEVLLKPLEKHGSFDIFWSSRLGPATSLRIRRSIAETVYKMSD